MLKIDKGVPIPEPVARKPNLGAQRKYPWIEMEVGDSFLVSLGPKAKDELGRDQWPNHWPNRIGSINSQYKPKRFITRVVAPGQVRIWRVA